MITSTAGREDGAGDAVPALDAEAAIAERLDLRTAWGVGAAACAVFAILEATKEYLFQRFQGTPKSWTFTLLEQLTWWGLWMVMMPLVLRLARRWRFDGPRWRRSVAVHALAGLALLLAHVAASGAAYHVLAIHTGVSAAPLATHVRTFIVRFLFTDVVTYCAAVGVYYAFEYFSFFRRSELAAAHSRVRAATLQLRLAEARLHALRMELNPHFLFNALNAVAGLVRKRENDAAVDTLARLGDLLRTTLDRDMPPEIPLSEELALLRRFLAIELVRFGDRLRVAWEVEPDTDDALVPPLILQPLLENALRHGISRRPGVALLRVSARRAGPHLELAVRDTGEGLAVHGGRAPREGIGLSNTRARLEELYGPDAATLELTDVAGGGARARLLLPFHLTSALGHVAIGA
ncbi:MAG: sensor histidine kinase [Gemmatimonadaceae bacterium]